MTETLVTVVVPSYNHSRYVGDAIRGLIAQTHSNIELLIIDDGSSDNSVEVIEGLLEECRARFRNTVFIPQQNTGLARTMNRAIELSTGEYLLLNGSDDIAEPEAIARLAACLDSDATLGLVACDNYLIDSQGRRCFWADEPINMYDEAKAKSTTYGHWMQRCNLHLDMTGPEFGRYEHLLLGNHIPNGYLMRKSAVVAAGCYDPKISLEDWPTHLRIARQYRMAYINEVLFNYRWHDSNTIHGEKFRVRIPRQILRREKKFACAHGHKAVWEAAYRQFSRKEKFRQFRKHMISIRFRRNKLKLRLLGFDLLK